MIIPLQDRDRFRDSVFVMKRHFLFPTSAGLSLQEVDRVFALANAWAERDALETAHTA